MNKMMNMPEIRLGIVAVSRDCFPASLSAGRRTAVCKACSAKGIDVYECPTTVESEKDMLKAVEELKEAGVNALVVYWQLRPRDCRNSPCQEIWSACNVCGCCRGNRR